MIKIADKGECCGCAACVQVCPQKCISFDEDEYGFRYPLVDKDICIDCSLCEKVCPVLNQDTPRKPMKVYASINPNEEIRKQSSSGGIFTMIAESIINEGGVVFGARFDEDWEVKHDYTDTIEGLAAFRGSKYVQSRIGETFKQVRVFLNAGRKVLFSGTSCQIAGLRRFLRKDYENLLTVDVVCHGVPSPLVWRSYLEYIKNLPQGVDGKNSVSSLLNEIHEITGISFRDKMNGWRKFGFVAYEKSVGQTDSDSVLSPNDIKIVDESLTKNLYLVTFLKNLDLRPSCKKCPAKSGKCGSDITLADYWKVDMFHPEMDDDKGTSLVLINTEKGKVNISHLHAKNADSTYENALFGNICIEHCVQDGPYEGKFWKSFEHTGFLNLEWIYNDLTPSITFRIFRKISSLIKNKIIK